MSYLELIYISTIHAKLHFRGKIWSTVTYVKYMKFLKQGHCSNMLILKAVVSVVSFGYELYS